MHQQTGLFDRMPWQDRSVMAYRPVHKQPRLGVHSKPTLYTWLDRRKHCELGEKMLMAKQECIRYKEG